MTKLTDYLKKVVLQTARAYTFNTPLRRGRNRVYMTLLPLLGKLPDGLIVSAHDGRRFSINWETGMQTSVFFLGEYEKAVSDIAESLIAPGDICVDAGANFGWYTSLFAKKAGKDGRVHSFEPVPGTFAELQKTVGLMGSPPNVLINNAAVSDRAGEMTINLFPGMATGHASLSNQGRGDAIAHKCRVVTLDAYLAENENREDSFMKVDIEGAELMLLRGAPRLFEQSVPPIMLMEMALNQSRNFGYLPNDLLEFISSKAAYEFYSIDEVNAKLNRINEIKPDDDGANVICFPTGHYPERRQILSRYL